MGSISKNNTFVANTPIEPSEVNDNFDTIYDEFNGNISATNLASNAVTTAKITDASVTSAKLADGAITLAKIDSGVASGWLPLGATPNTVTNNGNRSYDLVFNSNDVTDTVSNGMRLKLTRTVTAPTMCADLESGSSQYFSKANASGFSTGTTWTFKAKVKLESYAIGVIAALDDGTNLIQLAVLSTGQVQVNGGTIAAPDVVTSYQSLPLARWVDVTASITIGTPTGEIRFDDVVVPSFVTASAATTMTINGDETWYIGRNSGGNYFDGKIAQVAVFNAIISDSTLRGYSSQTMTGSETNCKGFWSLNNTLSDLSASANTLTAGGGALATNADSPFGVQADGTTAGTTEYAIITKTAFSTNTTLTVQVPEGCAIPTTGGVSAVSYSAQKVPYGFPAARGKWEIMVAILAGVNTSGTTINTVYNPGGVNLNIPIGDWQIIEDMSVQITANASTVIMYHGMSTSSSAFNSGSRLAGVTAVQQASVSNTFVSQFNRTDNVSLTTATPYYVLLMTPNAFTQLNISGGASTTTANSSYFSALPAHL